MTLYGLLITEITGFNDRLIWTPRQLYRTEEEARAFGEAHLKTVKDYIETYDIQTTKEITGVMYGITQFWV